MKNVFQGKTKKGTPIIIRYPEKTDTYQLWKYFNALSNEKTFIRLQGETISLNEETEYVDKLLIQITKKQTVHLCVFTGETLIGAADIKMQDKIEKHIGLFGITIAKKYRGEGIGKLLMKLIIDEAIKNIPELEIIKLGCFSNNILALNIYIKFGFQEYGRLPRGVKLHDKYVDHIYMYKNVSVPFSACPEKGTKEKANL